MPYVPAICPNCGADLSVDTEQEKGYCVHCGSMIDFRSAIQNAIFTQPIEFDGYESYSTLVGMIQEDLKNGNNQTPEFREKLNRAIELNPDDVYLYSLVESEIWNAQIEGKVLIQYDGNSEKVVVPEGIEIIDKMAFGKQMLLKEVALPKSLKLIREGAFIYESKLIIRAHADSYGARYAMCSPAELRLIGKEDGINAVEEIESILREFDGLKKATAQKLEIHFNKAYSIKWWSVLLFLSPAIYGFYISLQGLYAFASLSLFVILYVIVTFIVVAALSGYKEIRSRIAVKRQMQLFMQRCNNILNPLGISNFAYKINIFDNSYDDLQTELAKLKNARNLVFNQDLKEVYRKPKLYYSFLDYIIGDRPKDYNN